MIHVKTKTAVIVMALFITSMGEAAAMEWIDTVPLGGIHGFYGKKMIRIGDVYTFVCIIADKEESWYISYDSSGNRVKDLSPLPERMAAVAGGNAHVVMFENLFSVDGRRIFIYDDKMNLLSSTKLKKEEGIYENISSLLVFELKNGSEEQFIALEEYGTKDGPSERFLVSRDASCKELWRTSISKEYPGELYGHALLQQDDNIVALLTGRRKGGSEAHLFVYTGTGEFIKSIPLNNAEDPIAYYGPGGRSVSPTAAYFSSGRVMIALDAENVLVVGRTSVAEPRAGYIRMLKVNTKTGVVRRFTLPEPFGGRLREIYDAALLPSGEILVSVVDALVILEPETLAPVAYLPRNPEFLLTFWTPTPAGDVIATGLGEARFGTSVTMWMGKIARSEFLPVSAGGPAPSQGKPYPLPDAGDSVHTQ